MLAGIPLGLVWWLVAPVARLVKRPEGVFAVGSHTETAIAADGWFAILALVTGVVAALLAAFLLRDHRLGALAGLAVGGLLGSLVAWRLGVLLGPPAISDSAAGLANQARFDGPLEISAMGVLLAWSLAAVVTFFAAVAGLDAREPHEPVPATATSDVLPGQQP